MISSHSGWACYWQVPGVNHRGHGVDDIGRNRVTENRGSFGRVLQRYGRYLISRGLLPKPDGLKTTPPSGPELLPGCPTLDIIADVTWSAARTTDLHNKRPPFLAPTVKPTLLQKMIPLDAANGLLESCHLLGACTGADATRIVARCLPFMNPGTFHDARSLCEQSLHVRRCQVTAGSTATHFRPPNRTGLHFPSVHLSQRDDWVADTSSSESVSTKVLNQVNRLRPVLYNIRGPGFFTSPTLSARSPHRQRHRALADRAASFNVESATSIKLDIMSERLVERPPPRSTGERM